MQKNNVKEHQQLEQYFTKSTKSRYDTSDRRRHITYCCRRLVWRCCRNRSTPCRCVQAGHYRTSDIVSPAQDSDWTTYRLSPCHDGPLHTTRGSVPSSRHIHSYSRTPARSGAVVRVARRYRTVVCLSRLRRWCIVAKRLGGSQCHFVRR